MPWCPQNQLNVPRTPHRQTCASFRNLNLLQICKQKINRYRVYLTNTFCRFLRPLHVWNKKLQHTEAVPLRQTAFLFHSLNYNTPLLYTQCVPFPLTFPSCNKPFVYNNIYVPNRLSYPFCFLRFWKFLPRPSPFFDCVYNPDVSYYKDMAVPAQH